MITKTFRYCYGSLKQNGESINNLEEVLCAIFPNHIDRLMLMSLQYLKIYTYIKILYSYVSQHDTYEGNKISETIPPGIHTYTHICSRALGIDMNLVIKKNIKQRF